MAAFRVVEAPEGGAFDIVMETPDGDVIRDTVNGGPAARAYAEQRAASLERQNELDARFLRGDVR